MQKFSYFEKSPVMSASGIWRHEKVDSNVLSFMCLESKVIENHIPLEPNWGAFIIINKYTNNTLLWNTKK